MDSDEPPNDPLQAQRWRVSGQVQGVGFRPFVYRIATRNGLDGWVRNAAGTVEIHVQGEPAALQRFGHELFAQAPPLARPQPLGHESVEPEPMPDHGHACGFRILDSSSTGEVDIHVPTDLFVCDDCLAEFNDPTDRRYRYPFINCTQCGPRYSLITALPYDRERTTMAPFALCPACREEYQDPADRRFHAEPIACPVCGPQLQYRAADGRRLTGNDAAIQACCDDLAAGRIIAIKGIGGYHLICDAQNKRAIARLRERKARPHKPLAVMVPATADDPLAWLRPRFECSDDQARLLLSPSRPILLLRRRPVCDLPTSIAPQLTEVGIMLPYSPLHYRLLGQLNRPLVATSANLSGEPVLTDGDVVESRLERVADGFLHHDRAIQRPADDPVFRHIGGRPRPLRLGRGNAPLELNLPFTLSAPVLAVGGQTKNTVALAWRNRLVVSPHIGDLDSVRSREVFEQTIAGLCTLYAVGIERVICDAHPGYAATRWARACGLPVTTIFHHHAHAGGAVGLGFDDQLQDDQHQDDEPWLVFTWDGVGYGEDGGLWGGEALLGRPGAWRRVASMRPFRPPGGERAGREPWRSAAALVWEANWETDHDWSKLPPSTELARQAWQRGLNAPVTTAVGRLFDAAAALVGIVDGETSFEGQGPMMLEAIAGDSGRSIELPLTANPKGLLETDWEPLLPALLDARRSVPARAALFHASMAAALVAQASAVRERHGVEQVALSGGVFQNRILTERVIADLEARGFRVHLSEQVPVNDAGLSIGQIIEYAANLPENPHDE